jgi:hypothetical protein
LSQHNVRWRHSICAALVLASGVARAATPTVGKAPAPRARLGALRSLYNATTAAQRAKTSPAALTAAGVPEPEYLAMKTTAMRLFGKYAPGEHFFIGIGRSPTQLVATMELLGHGSAMNLPASGIAEGQDSDPAYMEHFRATIPDDAFVSGKTIVLMDLVNTGAALRQMERLLRSYMKSRGFGNPIQGVGFSGNAVTISGAQGQTYDNFVLADDLNPLLQGMVYNERGQYPEFHVGQTPRTTLVQLPYYQQLLDALRQRMEHDADLDAEVKRLAAQLNP